MVGFSGCNSIERLLGEDDDDDHVSNVNPGPAPAPTPAPGSSERYDLYKDGGGALNTDPQAGAEVNATTLSRRGDGPGEGTEFLRVHVSSTPYIPCSVSITFDNGGTGRTVDLSGRTNITFMFRYMRAIQAGDMVNFTVEDGNGVVATFPVQNLSGLNPNQPGSVWQTVSIPVSALAGLDLTKIKKPFGLATGASMANGLHQDYDFDDIRWEP